MNNPKLIKKGRDSPGDRGRQDCVVVSHRYNVNGLTQPPSSGCAICYGNCHRPKHQSSPTNWKASLNLFEMFPVARSNFIK
ncbi:hypothetical protein GHT06_017324 [Daphnia sinensis]|uniref:Uncharacterized protein n=1 Tax=Daphnia sinensis TaxID=1820382 RepID=A0AAD5KPQ7_9CRUS|nr:hypothetical protein GHT06_017324 [Daphnia sinensis]